MLTVSPKETRYALLRNAPPVPHRELLDPERTVAFLTIHWGDDVIFTGEVDPNSGFDLGESTVQDEARHFEVPIEILGSAQLPLVRHRQGGVWLTIPHAASVRIVNEEGRDIVLPALPGDSAAEAREIALELDSRAVISLHNLRFDIEHGAAGKRCERQAILPPTEVLGFHALSFAVMGSLLSAMAYFLPSLGLLADEETERDHVYLIQQYLEANAERQQNDPTEAGGEQGGEARDPQPEKQEPAAETGPQGQRRYAPNNESPLSHRETVETARQFGMVSLLETLGIEATAQLWNADIHAFAGTNPGLWGDELGDIAGNGLRLHSDGDGAGGRGGGIDMGDIEGLPGGPGGDRPGDFGRRIGRPGGPGYKPKAPRIIHQGDTVVSGHLPPELVQRTVRQNFGRFRLCYEQGLLKNPNLAGRIEVRFLIDSTGTVAMASQGASDLPDSSVVSCVVKQFFALSFPAPQAGSVRVTYPLMLSPAS